MVAFGSRGDKSPTSLIAGHPTPDARIPVMEPVLVIIRASIAPPISTGRHQERLIIKCDAAEQSTCDVPFVKEQRRQRARAATHTRRELPDKQGLPGIEKRPDYVLPPLPPQLLRTPPRRYRLFVTDINNSSSRLTLYDLELFRALGLISRFISQRSAFFKC
ncbi:hypothetical protein J6590_016821 [Homalodisca vitripennis]|nr:hypothetical protein J6590_016821 [Homalodisca vitripennis]